MQTDIIASTHLGKKSEGSKTYDPSLLVVVPREENRRQYNIDNNKLPFFGFDVWHAYEFSCLSGNGLPITRVIKLKYNCNNDFLIESKSLKLYLNSFNMTRFGKNIQECLDICKNIIQKDLSEKLQTHVELEYLDENSKRSEIFSDFENIMDFVDESSITIENFKESPELLEVEDFKKSEYRLKFDSLRSNCRVTHQPDFGDLFIYYKSNKHVKEDSLVKYLCSFRSEYHFHEECVEMIFKRISDLLDDNDELMICALYTRRGGIDISPVRWKNFDLKLDLTDIKKFVRCGIKQ
jgi:7-cyano-7-deazaguanine reductase